MTVNLSLIQHNNFRKRKFVPIGAMWIVVQRHVIMAAIILTFTASAPTLRVKKAIMRKRTKFFICNALKQVCIIFNLVNAIEFDPLMCVQFLQVTPEDRSNIL